MKATAILAILLVLTVSPVVADDLLEITLHNTTEATLVQGAAVATVDRNVYLVAANPSTRGLFESAGLDYRVILTDIDLDRIAFDRRPVPLVRTDRSLVYERNGLRIVAAATEQALSLDSDLLPLGLHPIVVRYLPPRAPLAADADLPIELDTLIDLVSEDSLYAYTARLEAFYRRYVETDSVRAARDWINAKFRSFGYDSVVNDPFTGPYYGNPDNLVSGFNVVACKPGTVNPDRQIIIGGHFDAAANSPGADDNATGTAGTLEIARVLAAADLPVTLVFIAFDAEESWMVGSTHYADSVVAEGADIILMINLDMIAHITNNSRANLYYGAEDAYARLWAQFAPSYAITGVDFAGSTASDHQPFADNAYDVIFVQEDIFSTLYHQPSDSTTYLNFEYMTRMVKASLHTALATATTPPPVRITSVLEPGDGHSQILTWNRLYFNTLDYLRVVWYPAANPSAKQFVDLSPSDTGYTVKGLTDNVAYVFYVQAFDTQGRTSYAIKEAYGTPRAVPRPPQGLVARPIYHGIRLWWNRNNIEMDFDHYTIVRDGVPVGTTSDTTYDDVSLALGSDMHRFYVRATDLDLNSSDTSGAPSAETKAAMLDPEKVLAVNRSATSTGLWVNEVETGLFLRDALATLDFDYHSDTAAISHPGEGISLFDMVSHGVMIVGDESGRGMDISKSPAEGGILDDLAYYCSIGGKLIVFGRFGTITRGDTIDYTGGSTYDNAFVDIFHIARRYRTATLLLPTPNRLTGDLVGAEPLLSGYPALVWDSTLTAAHSLPLLAPFGIPMASYVELNNPEAHPLYSYRSAYDTSAHNGGTIAWRYFGSDYKYIFFDIPLSFCERSAAIETLRKAVNDLMSLPTDTDDDPAPLPGSFTLWQNYPNPFNATTTIAYSLPDAAPVRLTIYNLLGQTVAFWNWDRQSAGTHTVTWNGMNSAHRPVATGIYLYRLESGEHRATRKMLLLK